MHDTIIRLIALVKEDAALAKRVTGSSHLVDDLGLDSIQLINLILLVEEEFAVEVDFDSFQAYHLSSLDRFTNYVTGLPKT
jgi:acyl carrier protein